MTHTHAYQTHCYCFAFIFIVHAVFDNKWFILCPRMWLLFVQYWIKMDFQCVARSLFLCRTLTIKTAISCAMCTWVFV